VVFQSRLINTADPIPKLPTLSLIANQYMYCEREIGLGAAAASGFLQGFVGKTVNGVVNASLFDDIWKAVQERLEAHALTTYLKNIGS
jgi:triacylglycerol lipase